MRRRKRMNKILLLLLLLLGVGIGFAAIATTLKINGIANVAKPSWNVYWANPVVTTGSVTNTLPDIEEDSGDPENTKISWTATLELPGDYYEFTIDAINSGSVDAMLISIDPTVSDGTNQIVLPNYIDYTVTYDDGSEVVLNHLLEATSSQKFKVRVYYDIAKMTAAQLDAMPAGGLSYIFSLEIKYGVVTDEVYKPPFRVGEYFIMEPDAEYATTNYAGFSGSTSTADQTLWRVIKVNASGSVEAVADNSSTEQISIAGAEGYRNFVAGLQDIASKYAKSGYTIATRCMGYDGQTLIADPYYFNGAVYTPPSNTSTPSPTTGNGEEYARGVIGDTLYLRDYLLVKDAYNGILTPTSGGSYWLASRHYVYESDSKYHFNGRAIDSGSLASTYYNCGYCNYNRNGMRYYSKNSGIDGWNNIEYSRAFRPIITLRSGITIASGQGSKTDPFILN